MSHILRIKILDTCPNRAYVKEYYSNVKKIGFARDCGVDIIFPESKVFACNQVTMCNLGIACEMLPGHNTVPQLSEPYYLACRSSIAKTPLMLANSKGIIDPEYRGPLVAAFRCFKDYAHNITYTENYYRVDLGTRLLQIVANDMKPIIVQVVDNLSDGSRGENGYGSTNK